MTIGETNDVKVSYIAESSAGTTPSTPAMQLLRFTAESLQYQNQTQVSDEIRNDRGVPDLVIVDQSIGGQISGEFSGSTYDDIIKAALMSDNDWTADSVTASTISATASGFSDSGSGLGDFEVGQFVYVSGFSDTSIDGYYRVTSNDGSDMDVYPTPPATEASGSSITIEGSTIVSGKTDFPFTFQKSIEGIGTETYINYRGCRVTSMGMSFSVGSKLGFNFNVMGQSREVTTTQITGLTETAKTTTEITNTVTNTNDIVATSAGLTTSVKFTDLTLNYDNTPRELKALGTLGAVDIRAGTINATAELNPYFEDKEMLDAFNDNEDFHLSWRVTSNDGYTYVFSLPKVKFTSQELAAGSKDADMILNANVRALIDTSTAAMRIDRFTP